jgi:hypothetical protein
MTFAEHRKTCTRCNDWALVHLDRVALSATPAPLCATGEALWQGGDALAPLNANLDPIVEVDGDSGGVTSEASLEMERLEDS